MLRGALQRLRSRYRLRAFADMLRGWQFPVGYRISAPRVSMELTGIDLVQPIFAKVLATTSARADAWNDLALEVRALSLDTKSTIVGAWKRASNSNRPAASASSSARGARDSNAISTAYATHAKLVLRSSGI